MVRNNSDYAGFAIRLYAKAIDILTIAFIFALSLLLSSLLSFVLLVLFPYFEFYNIPNYEVFMYIMNNNVLIVMFMSVIIYIKFFIIKYDATIGKKICRIKVITEQGNKLTYFMLIVRFTAELLSATLLCFGYIMAIFDPEKRTLHDRICSTRVVKADKDKQIF